MAVLQLQTVSMLPCAMHMRVCAQETSMDEHTLSTTCAM